MTVNNYTVPTGSNVSLNVNLPRDATGNVSYALNGHLLTDANNTSVSVNVTNGTAGYNYQIPLYSAKNYNLTAVYSGDDKYNSINTTSILTLTKINPTIELNNFTARTGSTITFKATFPVNATGNAVFKLNSRTLTSKIRIMNGSVSYYYQIPVYSAKKYNLSLSYSGNDKYNSARVNSTLTLTKRNVTIQLNNITAKTGTGVTLRAVFPRYATGTAMFKINGKSVSSNKIRVANSTASYYYKLPLYSVKNYTLKIVYSGDNRYFSNSNTSVLTLTNLNTTIKVNPLTVTQGQKTTFTATVTDERGARVNGTDVAFKLNGKTISHVKTVNGIATTNFTFGNGATRTNNELIAKTGTTRVWSGATGNATIKMLRKTSISLRPVNAITGSVVTLNASVVDANNKAVNTGTVEFKINGKTFGRSNVNNGRAIYTSRIDLLNSGNHNISAVYMKNNVYQTSTAGNRMVLTRINTTTSATKLNVTVGQTGQYTVNVHNRYNNAVTTGTVTVKIDNKTAGTYTLKNGSVNINYKAENKYSNSEVPLTVTYNQNSLYASSSYRGSITVKPLQTVYVSTKGNDANIGNRTHPFKTIKYAAGHVANNGTIFIQNGTYNENQITIKDSVNITGLNSNPNKITVTGNNKNGYIFNITSNSTVNIRNMAFKNTIIKNNNTGTITSYGVLSVQNCVFDNDKSNSTYSASAIYARGYLLVSNCTVNNNKVYKAQSSAIVNLGQRVIIYNVKFTNNQATGSNVGGPAIYLFNSNATIYGSQFINNKAIGTNASGGAVKILFGNMTVNHNTFKNNIVDGGNYVVGGAIANLDAQLYVLNTTFTNNTAKGEKAVAGGGALYNQNSILLIYNSTFNQNQVTGTQAYGGVIYTYMTYASIVNSKFNQNKVTATGNNSLGGAINFRGGTLTASYNRFTNNIAKGKTSYGGAIYFIGDKLNMTKTAFTSNTANGTSIGAAGAIYTYTNTTITNSNFTSNKALGRANGGGAIINIGNLTVHTSNFINNAASATGSEISNGGTIKSLTGNYWGSTSPKWNTIFYGIKTPSSYSKTKLSN